MIPSEIDKEKLLRLMEELKQGDEYTKDTHKGNTRLDLIKCSCKRTKSPVNLKGMNKHLLNK